MRANPLVSILTVTYNHRKYIENTIKSVLNQTYTNWEWIIIDDGSTDGTGKALETLKDKRIKYIYQDNAGMIHCAENYNKALQSCNGDLVAMLDGDDYWPAYKLDLQTKTFNDPDIILSFGECCIVDSYGKKISYVNIPDDPAIANNDPIGTALMLFLKIHRFRNYLAVHDSTVMIKKSALLDIGGYVVSRASHQDWPTWARLCLEGNFSAIPVCLGYWRRHLSAATYQHDPIPLFDAGINFLRDFVVTHENKLNSLGFYYNLNDLEKHWQHLREEFITYLPFNKAMLLLKLGAFAQARGEFKKFMDKDPSFKNRLGYALVALASLIHYDIVHPVISFRERLRKTA